MKVGKIYKIIHSQSNIIYVGSTFNTLRDRWMRHKIKSGCCIYKYIEKYGLNQFKIILIKEYEVIDREHLEAYEQLWINKLKSINEKSAFSIYKLQRKEYYENNKELKKTYYHNNKEKNKEKVKKYQEKNKEKIKEYNKEYNKKKILCDSCNCLINQINAKRHNKTKKHQTIIRKQTYGI